MNRRDFFRPQRFAKLASQVLDIPGHVFAPVPTADAEAALLRFARGAMATTFEIVLPFGTARAQEAAEAALDQIDHLEQQLTVYREESEVSRINSQAAKAPVQVEERLFDLLSLAARLSSETEGAFDVAVGALIKAWGFYNRRGCVPSAEERAEVMNRIGMKHVMMNAEDRTIAFARPGPEINLGSIGKGYALDRVAEHLRAQFGIGSALLHGGHSSVLALGTHPGNRRGWPVGLAHPTASTRRLGIIHVRNRALGTSAATFQHLMYNGKRLGHILDPRTGWPAEGVAAASVTAPTASEADALATAFYVLGVEKARLYCEQHPRIGAVILPQDRQRPVVLGYAREEFAG
jgi:thiamine biosynthesis lipoprotein